MKKKKQRNDLYKKQNQVTSAATNQSLGTLKDMLDPTVLNKLKMQSDELVKEEKRRIEEEKQQREQQRKEEQKRLDNDFEYLLNNSTMNWNKFK